ncbi:hypothetical protein [Micromonospora sp. CPCC 206061]|uniref:hypothetical protein n=1 Tax=Micromonospora sp. CPCC 206061 TaxID=3122410 RepID=UPI002FEEEAF2
MEPVSIGIAVAALLGTKAAEEFAAHAGSRAWQAVQQLGSAVRSRLSPRGTAALDRIGEGDEGAIVAAEVGAAASIDPEFHRSLEALLTEAGQSPRLATVMAVARDNAKQVNIGGDNSGPITF